MRPNNCTVADTKTARTSLPSKCHRFKVKYAHSVEVRSREHRVCQSRLERAPEHTSCPVVHNRRGWSSFGSDRNPGESADRSLSLAPLAQDGLTSVSQACSRPKLSAALALSPECLRPCPYGANCLKQTRHRFASLPQWNYALHSNHRSS